MDDLSELHRNVWQSKQSDRRKLGCTAQAAITASLTKTFTSTCTRQACCGRLRKEIHHVSSQYKRQQQEPRTTAGSLCANKVHLGRAQSHRELHADTDAPEAEFCYDHHRFSMALHPMVEVSGPHSVHVTTSAEPVALTCRLDSSNSRQAVDFSQSLARDMVSGGLSYWES